MLREIDMFIGALEPDRVQCTHVVKNKIIQYKRKRAKDAI